MTSTRLPASLAALAHFSGLHDYARLTHLPALERLSEALNAASERCAQPGIGAAIR